MRGNKDIKHNNKSTIILHGEVHNKVLVGQKTTKSEIIIVDGDRKLINKEVITGKEIYNSTDNPVTDRCWFPLDLETGRKSLGNNEFVSWFPGSIKYAKIAFGELRAGPGSQYSILKEIRVETLAIEGIEANNLVWYKLTSDSMTGYVNELQISQFVYKDN